MNISELHLTEEEIMLLSPNCIAASPAAIVLLKIAKTIYDRDVKRINNGEIGVNNELPRLDFRYTLGVLSLAQMLVDAPKEAAKWCSEK